MIVIIVGRRARRLRHRLLGRGDDLLAPEERAERAMTEGEELSNADFFWDM